VIDEEHVYYNVLRVVILSFLKGMSPMLAVEAGRRAVPEHVRPNFKEIEDACRHKDTAAETAAA
jgi:chemotaxis protein MotA